MGRTFVMGDIHGAYNALRQCLKRANFDYSTDHLICLGDVCDGWPDTKLCIDELLKIRNLTYIIGNHDIWTLNWMKTKFADDLWTTQGGAATMRSYGEGVPFPHIEFLELARPYVVLDNKLFVHAGIDLNRPLEQQGIDTFSWDRSLIQKAWVFFRNGIKDVKLTQFDEVYIGHTPIPFDRPMQSCEVWMMDTGAGWAGVLSMMNIESKEVFTSDKVPALYPGVEGRMKMK